MHQFEPSQRVSPPRVLSGRYRLDSILAQSEGGEVHLATQLGLERQVAVKLISKTDQQDWGEQVARLSKEAQVLARLNHVNVVTLHDFGKTEEGDFFLTMEYLDGKPLGEVIETEGPFSFDRVLRISVQIARALREAHAVGVVHRDLTAEDVFLVRGADENDRDHVKVINFGLAETIGGKAGLLVVGGDDAGVRGSPSYVSPEQICGDRATERSDIYAFGVLLYLMLTGRVPFSGGSQAEILRSHLKDAPPPPSLMGYRRRIPRALEELTLRCLEKEPEARFADARQLILALKAVFWALDPTQTVDEEPRARGASNPGRHDPDFGSDDLAVTGEVNPAAQLGQVEALAPPPPAAAPMAPAPTAPAPTAPARAVGPAPLEGLRPSSPPAPTPAEPARGSAAVANPEVAPAAARNEAPTPERRPLLPFALIGTAALVGALLFFGRSSTTGPSPSEEPSTPTASVAKETRAPAVASPTPNAPSPAVTPRPADAAAPSGGEARAEGRTRASGKANDPARAVAPTTTPPIAERSRTPSEGPSLKAEAKRPPENAPESAPRTAPSAPAPAQAPAPTAEVAAPEVQPVARVEVASKPEVVEPKTEAHAEAQPVAPPPAAPAPSAPSPVAPAVAAPTPTPSPTPAAAAPVVAAPVIVPAQPMKNVLPEYPARYVSQRYAAVVTLKVTIDEEGVPQEVSILEPARYPEFNTSAKRAAFQERYRPATRDGKAVPYVRTTRYNFAAP